MKTDTSEKGLESLIVRAMTGRTDLLVPPYEPTETSVPAAGGTGWLLGDPKHYDREYAVDLVQLRGFLRATQPKIADALDLDHDSPTRRKFLSRLQGEISKRGTIDVLRDGLKHGALQLDLFYGTPSPGNVAAAERHAHNRFSVTRQLRYSRDETRRSLDLALFLNGLPVATFELKNSLTKQAGPRSAGEALRAWSLRGALRRRRSRGELLRAPQGQGLVVPAFQSGLERRRWQPAEPRRAED